MDHCYNHHINGNIKQVYSCVVSSKYREILEVYREIQCNVIIYTLINNWLHIYYLYHDYIIYVYIMYSCILHKICTLYYHKTVTITGNQNQYIENIIMIFTINFLCIRSDWKQQSKHLTHCWKVVLILSRCETASNLHWIPVLKLKLFSLSLWFLFKKIMLDRILFQGWVQ